MVAFMDKSDLAKEFVPHNLDTEYKYNDYLQCQQNLLEVHLSSEEYNRRPKSLIVIETDQTDNNIIKNIIQ